jgi:hypothetical protein
LFSPNFLSVGWSMNRPAAGQLDRQRVLRVQPLREHAVDGSAEQRRCQRRGHAVADALLEVVQLRRTDAQLAGRGVERPGVEQPHRLVGVGVAHREACARARRERRERRSGVGGEARHYF